MTLFQGFLVFLLLIFVIYIIKFKSATYDRLFMVIIGITGVVLVLFPDLSSAVASFFNIGRGTDLVFYLWIMFSLFKFLRYEARINELHRQVTEINRYISLHEVNLPEADNKKDTAIYKAD